MTVWLDVNVLIALAWPHHVYHAAARARFEERYEGGWATCPQTEAGFVRVSCNPSVVRHNVTHIDAIGVLGVLTQLGSHTFWSLDQSILRLPGSIGLRLQGYRQFKDAALLAAAMQRNGQLVTLNSGIEGLVTENERAYLCVIPV